MLEYKVDTDRVRIKYRFRIYVRIYSSFHMVGRRTGWYILFDGIHAMYLVLRCGPCLLSRFLIYYRVDNKSKNLGILIQFALSTIRGQCLSYSTIYLTVKSRVAGVDSVFVATVVVELAHHASDIVPRMPIRYLYPVASVTYTMRYSILVNSAW